MILVSYEFGYTYYFSTHGCRRVVSSLLSVALVLELLEAAAAAARALLLKKVDAMVSSHSRRERQGRLEL